MGRNTRVGTVLGWAAITLLASLAGCGDGDPDDSGTGGTGGTGATGGAGGSGGAGATGASTSSSSSSSSSGAGASGGGGAGTGGTGGGPQCAAADTTPPPVHPCLDEDAYGDFFALVDPGVCVTAVYTSQVEVGYAAVPSWGKHGGPLLVYPGAAQGALDLVRLTPPAGQEGAMAAVTTNVAAMVPASAFAGAQAIDLPFFEQTALSWAEGGFPPPNGQVVLTDGANVVGYQALPFAMSGHGAPCEPGRLLYTGLSELGSVTVPPEDANALFAADSCGDGDAPHFDAPPVNGSGGGGGAGGAGDCGPPLAIHRWGDASGPLTVDSAGNVIVVMNDFVEGNDARGFAEAEIGRGEPPTAGTALFKVPGYGNSVAAMAPTATDAGMAVFQAVEGVAGLNPIVQRYAVNGGKLVAVATPTDLLDLNFDGAIVLAFNDRHDRIWLAISNPVNEAVFIVLERAP